jgi:hypothetical protein
MVGLSMDVFIDAQVDVLLAGHISVYFPTHMGDVNSHNQNKSRYVFVGRRGTHELRLMTLVP